MAKVLRLLRSGGCSYCSAPEHLVGKGRCKHIPGICFEQKLDKQGHTCVEIKSSEENPVPKSLVKEEDLNDYVRNLDQELSKEKRAKILEFFRNY